MNTWDDFLTDYENKIRATEAALDLGNDLDSSVLVPFTPPEHLGALPESLRPRALEVMRANEELERRLGNALDTIGRELAKTTQVVNGAHRYSMFGETVIPKYFDGEA